MPPATVLIADDHPLVREAVTHALRRALPDALTLEAPSFSALEAAVRNNPAIDLILLDINMPGTRGFSSLVFLRSNYPPIPVVMISSNEDGRTIARSHQFGAAGFIPKSSTVDTIAKAIVAVMETGEWFPPLVEDGSTRDALIARKLASLTPQQLQVLLCLGDGMSNKDIATRLKLSENTVKIHVAATLKKLDAYNRTQAALMVRELDLERPPDPDNAVFK